jgi:hypothetical protein
MGRIEQQIEREREKSTERKQGRTRLGSRIVDGPWAAKSRYERRIHMSIQNLEMIARHEISERSHDRIYALTLIVAIGIVLAALVAAV